MKRETTLGGALSMLAIVALLLPAAGRIAAAADAADTTEAGAADAVAPAPATTGERAAAITTDIVIGRPTALMATVVGAAFYVLSWPITAPSGAQDEALDRFIKEPGHHLIGPLGQDARH
jgi:hypothetical protein